MNVDEVYAFFRAAGLDVMARVEVFPVELIVRIPNSNQGLVALLPFEPTDWKEAMTYIVQRVHYYADHMDEFASLQEEPDSVIANVVLSMN